MKVQVEIDEEKINKIRELNKNLYTNKKIIDLALREFISLMHRQKLMVLRGKVGREGDLNDMRTKDIRSID